MIIDVTTEDIFFGIRNSVCCPIALASKRLFGPQAIISVGSHFLRVDCYGYALPKIAENFIEDFDDDKPVEPFSFEVKEKLWI